MINLAILRKEPEKIIALLAKKDPDFNGQKLHDLDLEVRTLQQEVDTLRSEKNELAKQARGGVSDTVREQSKKLGSALKKKEAELLKTEFQFKDLFLSCPNLPADDVPTGGKEQNKVIKTWGEQKKFDFPIKHHVELGQALGWLDFETAAKIAGSNIALYKKDAVRLLYALTMFMLKNNVAHGFDPVIPSALVNEKSLEATGNFPKFRDQVYELKDDKLFLSPTAEVGIVNMYRDHIFAINELPIKNTAWTSCFRREAGTYGAHERGLIRIHQFEKIELVTICQPEDAQKELESMMVSAESILQKLGLHYRVSLLAAQDMSFQAAKTYDIEVWLPGQQAYYEVSSVSDCTDFQARRGLIRYKKTGDKKNHLASTLNGSSLALPRLMVAIMETYQQKDGSIAIPDVLKSEGLF